MQPDLKTAGGWTIKQTNERPQFTVEHDDGGFIVSNQCNFLPRAFPSQAEAALAIIELLTGDVSKLKSIIERAKLALNAADRR